MEPLEKGDWITGKTLGSGGFGLVVLWKNKKTQEAIALKRCRFGKELSDKQSKRWQLEIDIMGKLNHTNVVKALEIPAELDAAPDETPVLAMEYCTMGDLRGVLNRPENCCGLSEICVRNLLQDISNAVEYLHSMRIIHRDLKPENIVLQDVDQKTVYKLIDLGYAKELDQGSLCHSFVGTLQYLAPELFLSQKYSRTVDFWSLGLVAHECIVGHRPFLPNMTPAQWMEKVHKKSSSHICVYTNREGNIIYSDKLFSENHLTRPFVESLEKWLRVMVEWDSGKRGMLRGNEGTEETIAFSMLKSILEEKIVTIFLVSNGKTYSYKVREDTPMDTLLQWFANDANMAVEALEFILPRGISPDMSKSAVQCWVPQEEEADWLLYAFPKAKLDSNEVHHLDITLVEELLRKKKVATPYEEQRRMWSHAVHFVSQVRQMHLRLLQAHTVLMRNLLVRCIPGLNKISTRMVKGLDRLQAKLDFCQESIKNDKQYYEEQKQEGISHPKLENSFQKCDAFVRKLTDLKCRVSKEETAVNCVNGKMVELQRGLYAQPKKMQSKFDESYKNAAETFQRLKLKHKDQRSISSDNTEMVDIIHECIKSRGSLFRLFFANLEKVRSCKQEVADAMKPLEQCTESIDALEKELSQLQQCRQRLIWNSIKCLSGKLQAKASPQSNDVSSTTNGPFSASAGHVSDSFQSYRSTLASLTNVDGSPMSLSGMLSQVSNSSRGVLQEHQQCLSLLQDQMSLFNTPSDGLNWDYLDSLRNPPGDKT